jgi:AcrR family transcriptional regulator
MGRPDATPTGGGTRTSRAPAGQGARLRRGERYDALVDAAAILVAEGDVEAVSMEAVAARARVSRPLVYKYFANRHELLAAVYRREATAFDAEVVHDVQAAHGFEDILKTMLRGVLAGAASRATTFAALRRAGARDANLRREQRERDRRTLRFFTARAVEEFDLAPNEASDALAILLSGVDSMVALWRADPTPEQAGRLIDLYAELVLTGLRTLAATSAPAPAAR